MTWYSLSRAQPCGKGRRAPAGSVTDSELALRVAGYKRSVAGRYRSIAPEDAERVIASGPMHVSTKIDGELWFLVLDGGDAALVSHNGKVLAGAIPLLEEVHKTALPRVSRLTILAGELFAVSKGTRPRVGDVAQSMAGEENAAVARLGFHAFDLMEGGDAEAGDASSAEEYAPKLAAIERLLDGGRRVRAIKTEVVTKPEDVTRLFTEWVESGKAEGLVVRSSDGRINKIKPIFTLDAAVVGYTVRADAPDQTRSMLLALMRDDGHMQLIGQVGNLGTEDFRRALHVRLKEMGTESRFRAASRSGALYRFIRPEIVVEVRMTDLQVDDSDGRPIPRMVLGYEAGEWRPVRRMAGISLIHPVLARLRDDKTVNAVDVRVTQILERQPVEDLRAKVEAPKFDPSTILRREVWAKATKGKTAVRKLMVWKTNKDTIDQRWPAYVVHWTDYSPGRLDPIKRVVRLAPTEALAMELAEALVKKGVKKGWQPQQPS
jgi:hypothetical protein